MEITPHTQKRYWARLSAVQALYQMEAAEKPSKLVVAEFVGHRFGHEDEPGMVVADEAFFEEIIDGVVTFQTEIDENIRLFLSKKWTLKRLDMTLRAILRAGIFELLRRPDVPALVVIDEYVTIAAGFFDEKERGFVNALLERAAKSIRAHEFGLPVAPPPTDAPPTDG